MKINRILVTGSSGFIGKSLVRKLISKGYEVIGLDLYTTDDIDFEQITGDITSEDIINNPIWKKIDYVYHLAAMANLDIAREFPNDCVTVNVIGTNNIVRACNMNNIPLCYISTCCCYGSTDTHPTTETSLTNPTEIYGATKLMAEYSVKLLKNWTILRIGTVIGPEMREALVTHIFLTQAMNNIPITIKGSGEQTRTWVYVEDLVEGISRVVDYNIDKEIINLAGFESVTVKQVADYCQKIVNDTTEYEIDYLPERYGDTFHEEICISKAHELLHWKPKYSVYNGLKTSYEGMI